jgi:protein-L-isoaspartate(D-aspartate) O-methyltransferase
MPDYDAQRFNMVEAQVRTNDVTDPRIHVAMREIPRERFVPSSKRAMAYADMAVEVAPGRFLLDPRTFAKLVQLASVQPMDRILDVGCATGYSSAVLGRLGRQVIALEQDADLVRLATEALASVAAANVTVVNGALVDGAKAQAPYDVVFVNGAVEAPSDALLAQLAEGGRLVAIVKSSEAIGQATLFLKQNSRVGFRPGFDANVPLLAGFKRAVGFVF